MVRHFVVGISGSSSPIFGIRLLEVMHRTPSVETHLVISASAHRTIPLETDGWTVEKVAALADKVYDNANVAAAIASGSFRTSGMVVAPCSMKTLAAVACAYTPDLLSRAADVTLKERRRLILLPRETPLHLGHLRNMVAVTEMGGVIMPPVAAFYHKPSTVMDLVDHTVGKVLDLLEVEHDLYRRWSGG